MGRGLILASAIAALGCGADTGAAIDAGPPPDAVIPDGGPGVGCRDIYCGAGDFCCVEAIDPPMITTLCVPDDLPDLCIGTLYACDGPEDCGEDQVCCTAGGGASCADSCSSIIVCHGDDDCPPPLRCNDTPAGIVRACG